MSTWRLISCKFYLVSTVNATPLFHCKNWASPRWNLDTRAVPLVVLQEGTVLATHRTIPHKSHSSHTSRWETSSYLWIPCRRGSRELPHHFCHGRIWWEDDMSGLSPDTKSASALILDFSASITVRNGCLLSISCPVSGILGQGLRGWRTVIILQYFAAFTTFFFCSQPQRIIENLDCQPHLHFPSSPTHLI